MDQTSFLSPALIEAIGRVSVEVIAIIVLSIIVYLQLKVFSHFSRSNEKLTRNVELNNKLTAKLLETVKKNKCEAKDLVTTKCHRNKSIRAV